VIVSSKSKIRLDKLTCYTVSGNMQKTFIIGHRNPDTDSVCAPYCYAWYKAQIEPEGRFIAGILGNLNPQTRFIFDHLGVNVPPLIRDVYPKAEDLMLDNLYTIHENEPVGYVTQLMEEKKVRTVPIVDAAHNYLGLISMHEIAHYFMPRQYDERPFYSLRPENLFKVIPGYYLKNGSAEEYDLQMMVGAMAFETFITRLNQNLKSSPDTCPLLIAGNRMDIIEYALKRDFPIVILTGMTETECRNLDTSGFKGWIFVSKVDTAETIRLLRISTPAKEIANKNLPVLKRSDSLKEIKKILLNVDHHGIAVLEGQKLIGLVTNSRLIDPPRHKVIMIDHNEAAHSVEGIEQADIVEIIDHHKLDIMRSSTPVYVYAEPLGSSCTLVYKHIRSSRLVPPREIAALLLSGILSDTIILRSPTTTIEDIQAAEELAELAELNVEDWGREIFRHAASLSAADPDEAIARDFKIYREEGYRTGIAQMEVITLSDLNSVKLQYLDALYRAKEKFALDWAMLLITDIIGEESMLLSTSFPLAANLIYHCVDENTFHLPDVLSRKKQLLPDVLHVLKEE